jgi:hypothetical protein
MEACMNPIQTTLTQRLAGEGVTDAPQIVAAARKHGIDPTLLAAVAAQETGGPGSNGGRNVVGDGGHGHGLFQIDDRSHAFASTAAAMDPAANADYAAGMLSGLLQRYNGNLREALSAYNSGDPTAAGTRTTWPDGRRLSYADSVMRHDADLRGGGTPSPSASEAALESARSEQPQTAQSISGLNLVAAHLSWRAHRGGDPTGHTRSPGTSYDSYINGGNDT